MIQLWQKSHLRWPWQTSLTFYLLQFHVICHTPWKVSNWHQWAWVYLQLPQRVILQRVFSSPPPPQALEVPSNSFGKNGLLHVDWSQPLSWLTCSHTCKTLKKSSSDGSSFSIHKDVPSDTCFSFELNFFSPWFKLQYLWDKESWLFSLKALNLVGFCINHSIRESHEFASFSLSGEGWRVAGELVFGHSMLEIP